MFDALPQLGNITHDRLSALGVYLINVEIDTFGLGEVELVFEHQAHRASRGGEGVNHVTLVKKVECLLNAQSAFDRERQSKRSSSKSGKQGKGDDSKQDDLNFAGGTKRQRRQRVIGRGHAGARQVSAQS